VGNRRSAPTGSTLEWRDSSSPNTKHSHYVDDCYLCPGNARVSGAINPVYNGVFVFDNDHPCVGLDASTDLSTPTGIYRNRPAQGIARVVCYTPRHDLSLAQLQQSEIENLLVSWQQQYTELGKQPHVKHVLVFENKGEVVGVSNPHPHCQIYATNFVFKTIETEASASARHFVNSGRPMFQEIIEAEQRDAHASSLRMNQRLLSFPTSHATLTRCTLRPNKHMRASLI
jgi:UDPglucose--hexose-1-phosphate uridylyltransferase